MERLRELSLNSNHSPFNQQGWKKNKAPTALEFNEDTQKPIAKNKAKLEQVFAFVPEPPPKPEPRTVLEKIEQANEPERTIEPAHIAEVQQAEQVMQRLVDAAKIETIETEAEYRVDLEADEEFSVVEMVAADVSEDSDLTRFTTREIEQPPRGITSEQVIASEPVRKELVVVKAEAQDMSDAPTKVSPDYLGNIPELEADNTAQKAEILATTHEVEAPVSRLNMDKETDSVFVVHEFEPDKHEHLELLFNPETIDTYQEINDLIASLAESEAALLEISAQEAMETEDILSFEQFVAIHPADEEVTIESIHAQANEQPLEQTFVQLVEYLVGPIEEAEDDALNEGIQEIREALSDCYITTEAGATKFQMTPEMTDNLLVLLKELGYQNPGELLVNFVNKFGPTFFLQSIEYLCKLNDDDSRQKLVISSDDTSISRLSKLLIKLVIGTHPLPDGIVV
jgi:hypothetical protein